MGVFGRLADGRAVDAVEIAAGALSARVIAFGASVQSLIVPDAHGARADIVLGHDTLGPYVDTPLYVGAAIGRYANRIAHGRFSLDGRVYDLAKSDGDNTLHGGRYGFDKVLWRIASSTRSSVTLVYESADGEQGFPGALTAHATYALTDAGEMVVTFEAQTTSPTVVAMTHHGYFNLAGVDAGADILDHDLMLAADAFTPVDVHAIPTGELKPVAGTPFDFRTPQRIGVRIDAGDPQLAVGHGYDHNFALRAGASSTPQHAARLSEAKSGRVLDIFTTEPGLQFYSGNFLSGQLVGKAGVRYAHRSALCLEPQRFPDTPNQPAFGSARLDPGETYRHVSIYKFSTL